MAGAIAYKGKVYTEGGGLSPDTLASYEATNTASKAYAVGDLIVIGDKLYEVTAPIASGDTIVVEGASANVVQTSVEEQLDDKQATLTFDNVPTNGSNNPVKSDGIYDELYLVNLIQNIEQGSLTTSGMNVENANRLRTKEYIPVTSGETYILSGLSNLAGTLQYNEYRYTTDDYATSCISYGNDWKNANTPLTIPSGIKFVRLIFKITGQEQITPSDVSNVQFEKGSISTSYKPYNPNAVHHRIDDVYDVMGENGAKNLAKITTSTQTLQGVTFDINSTDTIVTATGTCTGDTAKWLITWDDNYSLPKGDYIISGCPAQTESTEKYHIGIQVKRNDTLLNLGRDTGEGVRFSVQSGDIIRYGVGFYSGYAIQDSLIFKPMITPASDPQSDYAHHVPYAMTNRELTDNIDTWTEAVTVDANNQVTFTGLNDTYGYSLYCNNGNLVGIEGVEKTGSGTAVQLVFTLSNVSQGDTCKLRIMKG